MGKRFYRTVGAFPILTLWKGYDFIKGNKFVVYGKENLVNGGVLVSSHVDGATPYRVNRAAYPYQLHWLASRTLWQEPFSFVLGHKGAFQNRIFDGLFKITDFIEIDVLTRSFGRRPFMPWFLDGLEQIPCQSDLKEDVTVKDSKVIARSTKCLRVAGDYLREGGLVGVTLTGKDYQDPRKTLREQAEIIKSGAAHLSWYYRVPAIPVIENIDGRRTEIVFGTRITDHLKGTFPRRDRESLEDYLRRMSVELFAETLDLMGN